MTIIITTTPEETTIVTPASGNTIVIDNDGSRAYKQAIVETIGDLIGLKSDSWHLL